MASTIIMRFFRMGNLQKILGKQASSPRNTGARRYEFNSSGECWRAASWRRYGDEGGYVGRRDALHHVGQRLNWFSRQIHKRGRRCQVGGTQRAVECVTQDSFAVVIGLDLQLHHACAGTDQFHRLRIDKWRCNRNPNRQDKPRQHEAGDLFDLAQSLHGADYARKITSIGSGSMSLDYKKTLSE